MQMKARWWPTRAICCALLMILTGIGGPVLSAQATEDLPLTIAQRFMEVAFPDLNETDARVFATVASSFAVDFVKSGFVVVRVNPKSTDAEPFLNANIDVVNRRINQALFDGRRVNSRANELVGVEVEGNPGWTHTDVTRVLQRRGAKFAVDQREALEKVVDADLERLTALLGTVRRKEIEFSWPSRGRPIKPTWAVTADFEGRDGSPLCYSFLYEPIGGTLRSVSQRSCSL